MRAALVVALLAASVSALAAEPPKNAISIQPLAFASHGIAVQYERFMKERFSLAIGPAIRSGAGGDFSSLHLSLGGEVRYWIFGDGPFDDWSAPAMSGPFVAVRLDVAWMSLTDEVQDRTVGSMVTFAESAWLGYRMTAWKRVEASVLVGYVVRQEIDPAARLAAYARGAIGLGITVGWMF